MNIPITIEKVYGKDRQDRWGVVVTIKHNESTFKWMPTYIDLETLTKKLEEVEILNKELCNKKNEGSNIL